MPDMLVERGLDMTPVLEANPSSTDEEVYECFYAMIDDYVPERNQYLTPSAAGCRGLAGNAANRSLNLVDGIYYEINEGESEYSAMDGGGGDSTYTYAGGMAERTYGIAGGMAGGSYLDVPLQPDGMAEGTYGIAGGANAKNNESVYDTANLGGLEATYAMGSSALARTLSRPRQESYVDATGRGEITYDSGRPTTHYDVGSAAGPEPVYGTASPDADRTLRRDEHGVEEGIYSVGNSVNESMYEAAVRQGSFPEATYAMGTADAADDDEEGTYSMGSATENQAAKRGSGDMYAAESNYATATTEWTDE